MNASTIHSTSSKSLDSSLEFSEQSELPYTNWQQRRL
jgi:hypothetical protein